MMPAKNLSGDFEKRLPVMILETCVAEITHGLLCVAGLGCIWICPGWGGVAAALIDIVLLNLPFILIQRYNRPRLLHLQQKLREKEGGAMRVLILSCSTGQGHNATADAIKQTFEQMGVACEVADSLCFASKICQDSCPGGTSPCIAGSRGCFALAMVMRKSILG